MPQYHDGGNADKVNPDQLKHTGNLNLRPSTCPPFFVIFSCCFVLGYAVPYPLPVLDRAVSGGEKLPIGCAVEANYESRGSFFRGKIAHFHEDGECYDVLVCIPCGMMKCY
jgi:hypothetical protein